ncbi:MAG: hydrolase [Bacteroidetes bacterium CG23_combo_of_CG06-09_8_20_14_all_32_9]|nr:MAG: hydrolase [Bacteroidetes bacterium CG23_combo_of_CG06-09_8_20_14_all_32_9]
MKIAVDFDGTIVEHQYPQIGEEKLFAIETLKQIQKQGHQLILWTYRTGCELDGAIEFCRKRGLEFYAVNKNYPEEKYDETSPRKLEVDLYIDDRNFGGFVEWSKIWETFNTESLKNSEDNFLKKNKRSFWKRIFG